MSGANGEGTELTFGVLGPIEVRRAGVVVNIGGPQQRRLLAALLTEAGRVVSIDRLVDAVWNDGEPPDGARRSLLTYVSRLRAALDDGCVVTRDAGYAIETTRVDAIDFDDLVERASVAAPTEAAALLDRAAGLWRGPAFGEFADEWWARPAALRLEELRLLAEERRIDARLSLGQHDRAVSDLESHIAEHGTRERFVCLLMRALHSSGRQADALRAAAAFRERLADETGLDPSPAFAELEREILDGVDLTPAAVGGRAARGYVLGDLIGQGAHGAVYRSVQPGVGRDVAVKVLRAELADDQEFIRRFEYEAQIVARLEHPHIVPLYDFWREPGAAFLVFRLLRGGSAAAPRRDRWALDDVSRLVDDIGGALVATHAAGIAHGDVRSANVLFDERGIAYLADFGVAITTSTVDGMSKGIDSPAPPSSRTPLPGAAPTVADDVFGLGLIAWELLTGRSPLDATSSPESPRVRPSEPAGSLRAARPDIPDEIEAVLQRATSARRADRFVSASAFLDAWRLAAGSGAASRPPTAHQPEPSNPYKGLRPFGEGDALDFYGRDALGDQLASIVERERFVTIVGPSGSGKSSLVHAGLVPRLRSSGHRVVTMFPTADPLGQLRAALTTVATRRLVGTDIVTMVAEVVSEGGGPLVVLVDQFEELWTLTSGEAREAFLQGLADVAVTAPSAHVVVALRADFFDRPLGHPVIGPLVGASTFAVAPLTGPELLDAIRLPALASGVTLEPGLDALLVGEMTGRAASLPLLQFTLAELFDGREGTVMTTATYRSIGGIAGAIATRAEAVYDDLSHAEQLTTRRLFARLVAPGEDALDARRRARRSELPASALEVVDRLGTYRLLSFDHDPATREPTIEVAHESLLRSWPRVRGWLEEDRDWLRLLAHLSPAARAWHDGGRDPADLYRGARLRSVVESTVHRDGGLGPIEEEFVAASADAEAAVEQHDRDERQRLRRLLAVTAVLLVLAIVVGAVAVVQSRAADRQRAAVERSSRAARLENLTSQAISSSRERTDLGLLLAAEARRLSPGDDTDGALLAALRSNPGLAGFVRVPGATEGATGAVVGSGTDAVVPVAGGVTTLDLRAGRLGAVVAVDGGSPSMVRSSPDGRVVAAVTRVEQRSTLRFLSPGTGSQAPKASGLPAVEIDAAVSDAAIAPDGDVIALTAGPSDDLWLVATADGRVIGRVPGLPVGSSTEAPAGGAPLGFGPGHTLYVGSSAGPIRVIDTTTATVTATMDEVPGTANTSLTVAPDGTWLLAVGAIGSARIEVPSGALTWRFDNSLAGGQCLSAVVRHATDRFYCSGAIGRVAERELTTGHPTGREFDSQQGGPVELGLADGGLMLVAFSPTSGRVTRWNLDGSGPIVDVVAPGHDLVGYTKDGGGLVVGTPSLTGIPAAPIMLVNPASGDVERTFDGFVSGFPSALPGVVYGLVVEDGGLRAVARSTRIGLPIDGFAIPLAGVPNSLTIDPSGRWLFLGHYDSAGSETKEYDAATGSPGPVTLPFIARTVAITRDGRRVVTSGQEGTRIFDAATLTDAGVGLPTVKSSMIVGDLIVGDTFDGSVNLYSVDDLHLIASMPGVRVTGDPNLMSASDDGRTLLVRGGNRTLSIYDLRTHRRVGPPLDIGQWDANYASLRPDGRSLAVGGGSVGVQIWDLDHDHWAAAVCELAGRNLTRTEWHRHLAWAGPYRRTCPQYG